MSNVFFMLGLGTARKLRLSVFAPLNSAVYRPTLSVYQSLNASALEVNVIALNGILMETAKGQKSMPKSSQKLSLQQPSSNETKKRSKMFMIGDKTLLPAESASVEGNSLLLL